MFDLSQAYPSWASVGDEAAVPSHVTRSMPRQYVVDKCGNLELETLVENWRDAAA